MFELIFTVFINHCMDGLRGIRVLGRHCLSTRGDLVTGLYQSPGSVGGYTKSYTHSSTKSHPTDSLKETANCPSPSVNTNLKSFIFFFKTLSFRTCPVTSPTILRHINLSDGVVPHFPVSSKGKSLVKRTQSTTRMGNCP